MSEVQIKSGYSVEERLNRFVDSQEIDIPAAMLETETMQMIQEWSYHTRYESMAAGGRMLSPDEIAEQMDALKQEAARNVKTRLVLNEVIEKHGLTVTQDELETEAQEIAARQQIPFEMVKDFFGADFSMLKNDLLIRKAEKLICGSILD